MEEGDRRRIAPVFAADAGFQAGTRSPALLYRHLDQHADPLLVDGSERVVLVNAVAQVVGQELAGVVTREAQRHLREVVGAEREELRRLGDAVGDHGGARGLDHRAQQEVDALAALGEHLLRRAPDHHGLCVEFAHRADQRHHDLGLDVGTLEARIERRFQNGAGLHLGDFGVGDAQAAAPVAEHGVELVQVVDPHADLADRDLHLLRQLALSGLIVGHEFVQRRVEQTDRDRMPVHREEQALEVGALDRQQLGQRLAPAGLVVGQDHLAHRQDAFAFKEHVLGATQADAGGAKTAGHLGVLGCVGIGADFQAFVPVGQGHQLAEVAAEFGVAGADLTVVNLAGGAVERNPVALAPGLAVDAELARLVVHVHRTGAADAALAHAARDHRRVRGHAAACGEDALGHAHAAQVLGRGLLPHQNHGLARLGPFLGLVGKEDHLPGGRAGTRRQAARNHGGRLLRRRVEDRVQQVVQAVRAHAKQRGFFIDHALVEHLHRDAHHGRAGALAIAGLQHPELAFLDGEFHVLHVAEMVLQQGLGLQQLLVDRGHQFFERGEPGTTLLLADQRQLRPALRPQPGDLLRGANPGDHVFALGVDEELAVEQVFTRAGVAREGHAGGAAVAEVAEHHGLHVDRRAP